MLNILEWHQGTKEELYLPVPGTEYQLPATVIHGRDPGGRVLITSGIHAAEYVGIAAGIELARRLTPEAVTGTLVILHPVNVSGFYACTSRVPEDGKNLNSVYPGHPDGTMAERLAYFITREFYPYIDHYIDLHGGAPTETLHPHVYYCGVTEEPVAQEARRMAMATGFSCLVRLTSHNLVTTCSYGGSQGIPCILIELGCAGTWSEAQREDFIRRVRSVLNRIGVLTAPDLTDSCAYVELLDVPGEASAHDGCWFPTLQAGDSFHKGDLLGVITDCFGAEKQRIIAGEDGILLYQRCTLSITQGTRPFVYGRRVD